MVPQDDLCPPLNGLIKRAALALGLPAQLDADTYSPTKAHRLKHAPANPAPHAILWVRELPTLFLEPARRQPVGATGEKPPPGLLTDGRHRLSRSTTESVLSPHCVGCLQTLTVAGSLGDPFREIQGSSHRQLCFKQTPPAWPNSPQNRAPRFFPSLSSSLPVFLPPQVQLALQSEGSPFSS